jgi:hypothetical protein
MPAQLGKSLVARRSYWDYTGKEEQNGDLTLSHVLDFLGAVCYVNVFTLQVPHPAFLWPRESLLTSSFRQ